MKYAAILSVLLLFLVSCGKQGTQEIQQIPDAPQQETPTQEQSMIENIESSSMIEEGVDNSSESMMEAVQQEEMKKNDQDTSDTMMQEETMESKPVASGVYTDYDASLIGQTENTVLFFHANWCPSCRAADAGISEGTIPDTLSILKLDYDSETALKKKYEVLSQHTFVQVDADGNMIKKWVGGTSVSDIEERLN